MITTLKRFCFTSLLAIFSFNSYATATDGTIVNATGITRGGSDTTFSWSAPAVGKYKVWVKVPNNGTATNAQYSVCLSSIANPCIVSTINQATNQNKWVQLAVNKTTSWSFAKGAYVSVNASNISSSEFLAASSVSFEDANPLAIGQTYQGGIIFYLDKTGKHGLVAAPKDILDNSGNPAYVTWYNGSYTTIGTTGSAIDTGKANTAAIIASQGVGNYAAKLADDLVVGKYSDWYLPSRDELNLIYTNIGQGAPAPLTNIGGFVSDIYWSSSEYDYSNSWSHDFFNGHQNNHMNKYYALLVRAVRTF
jgi:hypothetical protein